MAEQMDVPFLGQIPIDPRMVEACDAGRMFVEEFSDSDATAALNGAVGKVVDSAERDNYSE